MYFDEFSYTHPDTKKPVFVRIDPPCMSMSRSEQEADYAFSCYTEGYPIRCRHTIEETAEGVTLTIYR